MSENLTSEKVSNQTLIVIQPKGRLDITNSDMLRQEVADRVVQASQCILIDCQDIAFLDSSGLSALVMALKRAKAANSQLALCAINDQAMLLFRVTGMNKVFEIFDDRAAFEKAKGLS